MLAEYMDKAMRHAQFKRLEDGTIFGSIPGFQGVWADAATEDACRIELREALEGWIRLGIAKHDELPMLPRHGPQQEMRGGRASGRVRETLIHEQPCSLAPLGEYCE